jgi:hypothetical protein
MTPRLTPHPVRAKVGAAGRVWGIGTGHDPVITGPKTAAGLLLRLLESQKVELT